jgi:hypothetical protein
VFHNLLRLGVRLRAAGTGRIQRQQMLVDSRTKSTTRSETSMIVGACVMGVDRSRAARQLSPLGRPATVTG